MTAQTTKPTITFSRLKKAIILVLAIVVLVIVFAVFHKSNTKTQGSTSTNNAHSTYAALIEITAKGFIPQTLEVKPNTTVTWKNEDNNSHKIVSDNNLPSLESPALNLNQTYSYKFTAKGKVDYHDPLNIKLAGEVNVQ